jgi:hypothetical protein
MTYIYFIPSIFMEYSELFLQILPFINCYEIYDSLYLMKFSDT